ncbi:MAG: DMT family transporter [Patescibacteria group bacterium]
MKKYFSNPLFIPLSVLFLSAIVGGLPPVGIKIALRQLESPMILLFRLLIMIPLFLLVSWKHLGILKNNYRTIFPVAIFWMGNIVVFAFGIPYTTASVSQVLYTGVPVLVAALSPMFLKENPTKSQIVGICIGILGTLVIVFGGGGSITSGSLKGNVLVFIATLSWSLYILYTRKQKSLIPASVNLLCGTLLALPFSMWLVYMSKSGFILPVLTMSTIGAVIFVGFIGGFVMFILHQWSTQRVPAVMSASTGYISVISSTLAATYFLGEHLKFYEWMGLLFLIVAVVLTATLPLLARHIRKTMI